VKFFGSQAQREEGKELQCVGTSLIACYVLYVSVCTVCVQTWACFWLSLGPRPPPRFYCIAETWNIGPFCFSRRFLHYVSWITSARYIWLWWYSVRT